MANFSVDAFMQQLEANEPKTRANLGTDKTRSLEKIYLNYSGNYGRYQVYPLNSRISGFPFVTLNKTREIKVPRKNMAPDGTESLYEAWIKLLPKDAYQMIDDTGRITSSLTADDDALLDQAYSIFDQLYEELGGRLRGEDKQDKTKNKTIGLLRERNYTIFHAKCINFWEYSANDREMAARQAKRQNFSGLFICTAKGLTSTIRSSIQNKGMIEGSTDWVNEVYTNNIGRRTGFLMFSINLNDTRTGQQPGYTITADHASGKNLTAEVTQEEAEMMQDPVESFLSWQASKKTPGRLFNKPLIEETIGYMTQQLAAVRAAKTTGLDVMEAVQRTSEQAFSSMTATNNMGQPTNDPMLAQMAQESQPNQQNMSNPGAVYGNNTQPFQTPPAAHMDPITGAPVAPNQGQQQGAPFSQPGFAQGFNGGQTQEPQQNNPFNNPFNNAAGTQGTDLPF